MRFHIFVSNAQSGSISCYRLGNERADNCNELFSRVSDIEAAPLVMPMAIDERAQLLYVVSRSKPYQLQAYKINNSSLELVNTFPLPASMANIELTPDGNTIWMVSFNDNLLARLDVSNPSNQETITYSCGKHPHAIKISPDLRWFVHTELGSDTVKVMPYSTHTGPKFSQQIEVSLPQGSGPRHLVFSPSGKTLYVLTEMSGEVFVYSVTDEKSENNKPLSFVTQKAILPFDHFGLLPGLMPENRIDDNAAHQRIWAADIQITHNGRFLYTTERNSSQVSLFHVNEHQIRFVTRFTVETCPRSIAITPDDKWLIVTGAHANVTGLYAINPSDGNLTHQATAPCGQGASWVSVIEA